MSTETSTEMGTGKGTDPSDGRPAGIRASDVERDQIARMIQQATAEGRLTVDEADDRLAAVFAAKYRDELPRLVADLPRDDAPEPTAGRARRRRVPGPLAVHAAIVAVWSALLITRWAVSGADFFWPVFPIFWLTVSLLLHAGYRLRPARRWSDRPAG